jgi:hypothetical protein
MVARTNACGACVSVAAPKRNGRRSLTSRSKKSISNILNLTLIDRPGIGCVIYSGILRAGACRGKLRRTEPMRPLRARALLTSS